MLGVFIGSAALIIILSVFNGFETLVLSMYHKFTAEIRIEPAKGKTFDPETTYFKQLKKDKRISNYVEVLQEKALLRYDQSQYIGLIKGVSDGFTQNKHLNDVLLSGNFVISKDTIPYTVIGASVQAYLSVNIHDDLRDIEVYSPKKGVINAFNPAEEFTLKTIHPAGVYEVPEFDEMIIVPLTFARDLLGEDKNVSAIEINLHQEKDVDWFQEELTRALGEKFVVKNRIQQNQALYKTLNLEKWATFLILTFIVLIAIFNIIGSLTMLVIDKKKDIAILGSMGLSNEKIRRIFFFEGMMIALAGCVMGIAVGFVVALMQQKFGFIRINEPNLLIEAYPVTFKVMDFVFVFMTVMFISVIASLISSGLSIKNAGNLREDL